MIRCIVFDFDGMVYLTKEKFSDRLVRDFNIPAEEIKKFFQTEFANCQLGTADLKAELQKRLETWKWQGTVDELLEYWFSDGNVDEEVLAFVADLRSRGIKCLICTNNEKYRLNYLRKKYNLDEKFDGIVASYEVNARKPDERIYQNVAEIAQLLPEEIMICDDKEENLKILCDRGFASFQYGDFESFKKKINFFIGGCCRRI
jgi:putative hydrolase of the HAD superfamily